MTDKQYQEAHRIMAQIIRLEQMAGAVNKYWGRIFPSEIYPEFSDKIKTMLLHIYQDKIDNLQSEFESL